MNILERVKELYQNKKIESKLEQRHFIDLFKEGVKDSYPKVKEEYDDQTIYGVSFEIANVVQSSYNKDFTTFIYFNTEEMYEEAIEDCEDEEEKSYYRFSAWSEWDVTEAESTFFDKMQVYLTENSLGLFGDISEDVKNELPEEIKSWFESVEDEIEEAHEKEREDIRMWQAQALGELRKEGFWEAQGNADIYVIPFEGEGDIEQEEMIATFKEMDQGCHGSEYLEYIEENI